MILDALKRLDAYPKISLDDRDFRNKTIGGAAITVTSTILMLVLLSTEIYNFMQPNITEDLFVDTTRGHKLKINLDLIMPKISCEYLSLDAMDSAGDSHLHIDHDIFKKRLDLDGNPIDAGKKSDMITSSPNITTTTTISPSHNETEECGSCYGAQQNATHCCQTCADVIEAYRWKRWNPNTDDFVQCKREGYKNKDSLQRTAAFEEGCQIYGHLEVNRMGGSFHIAPGQSFTINHIHVHDVHPYTSSSFNTSHFIKHLSFGERINFANTHPLDDMKIIAEEGATMYQYYIKIVPTMYVTLNNTVTYTNQFSVTRHSKASTSSNRESGMPGIFFSYELSPLMVKYTEHRNSLGHLATNICAIVGGIFTVAGIIDSIFYNSLHLIRKKIELGKFS